MADKTVVRNAQYKRGGLNKRERHNERKNADYMNDDIIKERAALNVHFKQAQGGYESTFDKMVADGLISTRGLGKDPNIVDELVFDVNSAYFENNGGYEYAKSFFEEAYRCAVEEIGGEQFVLSAVMHADERNKALSEQYGRDVFHYHLHVVYVPVVQKEIYFKKNNKDPEKAGKLREVITQVSHSKKWPKQKKLDENGEVARNARGKTILVNVYSLLQDHFYQHMTEAGFTGFERGERGSAAEHLSVTEYKTQQEIKRAAAATAIVEEKQEAAAALDKKLEKKEERLERLDGQLAVKEKAKSTFDEIDAMGKLTMLGNFSLTADELTKLKALAKKSLTADEKIRDANRKRKTAENEREAAENKLNEVNARIEASKKSQPKITEHITWFNKFIAALKRAPKRLTAVIEDILRNPPERQEQGYTAQERKRETGLDMQ
jgi:hypothetical protein